MPTAFLNQDQIDYWNGRAGLRWAVDQETLDRSIAQFGEAALTTAAPRAGEQVLDVGCGAGATAIALARAVGPSGNVLAVDVSKPMLARARERAASIPNLEFLEADAAVYPFEATRDLLFSRFGVMFFADPTVAFTNLRRALRAKGRLSFVCWRTLAENPWMQVPLAATATIVPPGEPTAPDAPGPMAFADRERVKNILTKAGFARVEIEPFNTDFVLSDRGVNDAVEVAMRVGPSARLLVDVDDEVRARVRDAIHAALSPHAKSDFVALPAATWLVSAHVP